MACVTCPGEWENLLQKRFKNLYRSPCESWIEILDVVDDFLQGTGYKLGTFDSQSVNEFPVFKENQKNGPREEHKDDDKMKVCRKKQDELIEEFDQEIAPLFPEHLLRLSLKERELVLTIQTIKQE